MGGEILMQEDDSRLNEMILQHKGEKGSINANPLQRAEDFRMSSPRGPEKNL